MCVCVFVFTDISFSEFGGVILIDFEEMGSLHAICFDKRHFIVRFLLHNVLTVYS